MKVSPAPSQNEHGFNGKVLHPRAPFGFASDCTLAALGCKSKL